MNQIAYARWVSETLKLEKDLDEVLLFRGTPVEIRTKEENWAQEKKRI